MFFGPQLDLRSVAQVKIILLQLLVNSQLVCLILPSSLKFIQSAQLA